jgi:hypothetical protein
MHHVEDNTAPHDLSSTEPFRRDSPLAFLRYWLRFALLGSVEVPLYAWRRGRRGWAARAAAAIAGYWAAVGALAARNPVATLYTLALPYALSSLLLMFGNWCAPPLTPGPGARRRGCRPLPSEAPLRPCARP